MQTEFEAKFLNIDKDIIRERLEAAGVTLKRPEFLQRRVVFLLPKGNEIAGGWLRVRDEGNKITMSLKAVTGSSIHDQKEIQLEVNNFEQARNFLISIGCKEKAYQETKRELWRFENTEITIDEWPFVEPFVEVEGTSEEEVRLVSERFGFNWDQAVFGAVDVVINKQYGIPLDVINNQTPKIVFSGDNPWRKWLQKNQ